MRDALHGDVLSAMPSEASASPAPKVDFSAFTEDSVLEFGYCTEFLLRLQRSKVDLDTFDESVIHDWLETRGDSLVFFRDGSIIKVHVHTLDPGAVLTKCREWGEFLTIKVENMTLQHHENHMDERFKRTGKALGIVTVASGKGLTATFQEMGADAVIEGGQTMNPSVERFLEAFDNVGAETILVFPNNSNIIMTARQAADIYDKSKIVVIPTHTLGEGYYAMANLQTDLPLEELTQTLEEAAKAVTTGSVSKAIRDTADARTGEFIGFSGKDVLCCCPKRPATVQALAQKLSAQNYDIIILLQGADAPADEATQLQNELQNTYKNSEVILIDGGQPVYDYILVLC